MKKNVASQVIGVQMVSATDGSAFTGAVTVVVTGDGGTQGASGGTGPTHEGNGYHTYIPTQAETNYDLIGFTFTGSGAVPVTVQVFTTFPQSADAPTAIAALNNVSQADITGGAYALNTTASGNIGIDWANIENPTTAVDLSGTDIQLVDTATSISQLSGNATAVLNLAGVFDTQFSSAYDSVNARWRVDITAISGDGTAAMNMEAAFDGTGYAFTACTIPSVVGSVGSVIGAVDSVNGNVGGNVVGSVGSVTSIPDGAIGAAAVADIFSTTALTESYAADGATGTPAQLLYLIQQAVTEFAFASTLKTIKKLDGSTTAATMRLDDAANPTSSTRES